MQNGDKRRKKKEKFLSKDSKPKMFMREKN